MKKEELETIAKRSSATSRKCRCEFAIVLSIKAMDTGELVESVTREKINESYFVIR